MSERVVGIGGVFMRARDPVALAAWYRDALGIPVVEGATYAILASTGPDAVTVWAAFPQDSDYLGARDRSAMINFRVADLDAMREQLRAAGAVVDDATHTDENGRFGWVTDPEGNRFELWQPAADTE